MKKLLIRYRGWGENWPLGELADDGEDILFEYSRDALEQRLELSPIRLPLRAEAYGGFPGYLHRLPGLAEDALPDGWGLLLMDRLFRKLGREPATASALDRLAVIGDRAIGALTFEPASSIELTEADSSLLDLAKQVKTVLKGKDTEVIKHLFVLGGSPQGARPKALVGYDAGTGSVCTVPDSQHRPFIIKFPAEREKKEVCAIEHAYCQTARACGIEVPQTRYFDLSREHAAFGIARFDVEADMRVPVHTLAGALHADFRLPQLDYITMLRATRMITADEREVRKAFERAVFNVIFNNRDDHPKNFSFRLNRNREWQLSPAYDITFSQGPGGEHQMDVAGEGRSITRAHLFELAKKGGIKPADAVASLERILGQSHLEQLLKNLPVSKATVKKIVQRTKANTELLRK